jgi:TPR repeat protein
MINSRSDGKQVAQLVQLLELSGVSEVRLAREYVEAAGFSISHDLAEIHSFLNKRASEKDREAQFSLAQFYKLGFFGHPQPDRAFHWCALYAEMEYAPAISALSGMEEYKYGPIFNRLNIFIERQERALSLGYGLAARYLGSEYIEGGLVKKDVAKAKLYFEKGASLGDAECVYRLVLHLSKEDGTHFSDTRIKELLERAASLDHLWSLRTLERLYKYGEDGFHINEELSEKYKIRADLLEKGYRYAKEEDY